MKLSIRFSGLFTLANGLKKTGGTVDPSSRGDLLYADASKFHSSGCKHPATLPPHRPVLLLLGEAIDWSSPLALDMGTYRSVVFPGSEDVWCLWDLDGAIVKVVEVSGTSTSPVAGGLDYDSTVPAGKVPAAGEEGSLKWLLSVSSLYTSRPQTVKPGLLKGAVTSPVLCRVELEGGWLQTGSLFKSKETGNYVNFKAVDGNHVTKTELDQALAEDLLWSHTFGARAPGLILTTAGKGITIPLSADEDRDLYIQSEPAHSMPTGGRADHLLATYQLTEEVIPDVEKRIPWDSSLIQNAGGTHCPPDQVP